MPENEKRTRMDLKALHKIAVDLLTRFHIVYKTSRIYAHNNDMIQEQAKSFFDALTPVLQAENEASFKVRQGSLFFNGLRVKFVLTNYPIYKFILEEFRKKSIGRLDFLAGLTQDELVRAMTTLSRKEKKVHPSFEDTALAFAEAGVTHIVLEKAHVDETFVSPEKNAAKIYFLSIFHLKEAFEKDQRDEKLKLNTTRRLMQSIFNHVSGNESFVYGLTNIKNYDEYTLNHSVNVCMLSIALGRRLGLSRSELVDLGMAAFFHDLGKLDTPLEILNKPARLSDEEREIMELHPTHGAEKLVRLREFRRLPLTAIHVALEHHIKEDLSGYPHYFKKETTNIFSKIVKVVDYFDAITTKRIYRKKVFTRAEALNLMLEQIGTEFHPVILKAFVNLMGAFPIGSVVLLNTGEIAIVFDTNPESQFLLRPKVKLITDAAGNRVDGEVLDLAEKDPATDKWLRSIIKPLDPDKYDIRVPDYFLAQAQ
jgi:HD-GYP domain-containing protein (c-di-GMP phosphodiesterase class II)